MPKKKPSKKKQAQVKSRICRLPLAPDETLEEPARIHEISWRIFRIMSEFVEGFQFLSESTREVTIFGSARTSPKDRWYKEAEKLGAMLGKNGFAVISGGGPGIMEAVNKGAKEACGVSIGLNIQLPSEQRINRYVTSSRAFHYFFTRKVMLAASAQAYIYFPGGFGTMDELFEIVTLIQTGKMQGTPVICVGHEYWDGLFAWVKEKMLNEHHTVSKENIEIIQIVDTAKEAFKIIEKSKERTFF